MRIRIVDVPNGNLYVYVEVLLGCLSYVPGYRPESDYASMYEEATAHYGFNPDEVNPAVFNSHPDGKLNSMKNIFYPKPRNNYLFFSFDSHSFHRSRFSSANTVDNVYQWSACTPEISPGNTDEI